MSSTRFTLPANFSYDDPLPFQCNENLNLGVSLAMYGIQASYLILGAVLNILIVHTIFKSKNSAYRNNSFYLLYTADAVMGIYINFAEVFFGRLFIYITPLCPIVSPFFFTPSIITKFYYAAVHYSLGFKTVSQIFMSFNRMTCVAFPMKHLKLWRNILTPVLVSLFILPLGVIWNILISRVYINPNGAGFSVNYKDTISWIYFAFFAAYTPSIRGVLLLTVSFVFDSMNVFSPIALIFMSRQLRKDIFHLRDDETQPVSRSVSTTSHHQPLSRAVSTVVAPITS
ncbi:unnamed protein product [Caenorhabditis brenneri]